MLIDLAEVVVFHHALGLTGHVLRFADGLRAAGHTVHAPDLYDGRTFHTIEDGMARVDELGGPMAIVERARAAVAPLPNEAVYIGFSLGVLSAQALAQTRAGARGAVLCYSAVPVGDEDFEIAQQLAATVSGADLFVYPGGEHYFAEHDEQAAALLMERVLDFLAAAGHF